MSPLPHSLRRGLFVLAATLALAAFSVRPVFAAPYDYTDNWYAGPAEAGWGVNFTQSDNFIFGTLFIYGSEQPRGQPTWYTAQMTWNEAQGQFVGGLYRTEGTYFANPWNPANNTNTQVGTASFTPSTANNYQGTFVYTVNGVTVTKAVTRLTLTPVLLAANYVGGQSGSYSGCTSQSNSTYQDFFTLEVTQSGTNNANIALKFTYSGFNGTCTLAGTLIQNGSIYRIPNATYQCSDGLSTNASVSELRATPLGIEGQYTAFNVEGAGTSCRETARFGGTLN